ALGDILTDPALRADMAANARPSVERFSWQSVATSVMRVYGRLAAGHRGNLCSETSIFREGA
ncbi:MAG: hypothetical protein ACR2J8_03305, partial [Thermomicrobiales bacterium]